MTFTVSTSDGSDVVDVTERVAEAVEDSGVDRGIGLASVRHTTCGLVIQENEEGLVSDLCEALSEILPEDNGYRHDVIDDNAHAHLRAALTGNAASFPVRDGEPVLGTWQRVLLLEFDGPRTRTVEVEVVG